MNLKSFGCSFIFGTDLPDDGHLGPLATPSHCTYPALIAAEKGFRYSCHARPGAGNFEILNRLIGHMQTTVPTLFLINWTYIDRFSYISEDKKSGRHPYNPEGWASVLPLEDEPKSQIYYKEFHTQIRDKLETLICIKFAIDNLKKNNHQFIMTWTDALIWETEWHCPPAVTWLQREVRDYLADFEGMSFLDWSRKHSFPISDTMHPLEDAHRAAANMILDNWDSFVKN